MDFSAGSTLLTILRIHMKTPLLRINWAEELFDQNNYAVLIYSTSTVSRVHTTISVV